MITWATLFPLDKSAVAEYFWGLLFHVSVSSDGMCSLEVTRD